jgi:hypothetical protein
MLLAYVEIADPEKITMFERVMSGLVSIHLAERLVGFIVGVLTETEKERVNNAE